MLSRHRTSLVISDILDGHKVSEWENCYSYWKDVLNIEDDGSGIGDENRGLFRTDEDECEWFIRIVKEFAVALHDSESHGHVFHGDSDEEDQDHEPSGSSSREASPLNEYRQLSSRRAVLKFLKDLRYR